MVVAVVVVDLGDGVYLKHELWNPLKICIEKGAISDDGLHGVSGAVVPQGPCKEVEVQPVGMWVK